MKLKNAIGAFILGATLVSPFGKTLHAAQASGSTDIMVRLPNIIILHYLSDLTLDFSTDISEGSDEGASSWTTAWNGGTSTGTAELAQGSGLNDNTTYELDGNTTINVTIPNVWAIRGFSSNGTATVSIAEGNTTLTNTQADSIELSDFEVSDGSRTGDEITGVALNGIAKSTATLGNVNLIMDLSGANTSGDYLGDGTEYTITATAI